MLKAWEFWTLTVVALVAAALAAANMMMFTQNRAIQAEAAGRAQFVQQSAQLEGLYREIIKALADLSVRNQDNALRDLLAAQGITVNAGVQPNTATTPVSPVAPVDASKATKP